VRGVRGGSVARETAANGAGAGLAGDVRNAGDRSAVDTSGSVGRQREDAATAALKVIVRVNAFPGTRAAAEHAACHMAHTARVACARAGPALVTLVGLRGGAN